MKAFPFFLVICVFFLAACSAPGIERTADFTIATANILFSNTEPAKNIASVLTATEADILVINEAIDGENVFRNDYNLAGYSTYYMKAAIDGFSILVATKIDGEFGEIPVTHISTDGSGLYGPHATFRINVKGCYITVIGVHIPPDFFFPPTYRKKSFQAVQEMISGGVIVLEKGSCRTGDLPVMAGDFNTLPTEQYLVDLYKAGLTDSFVVNPDYYDLTWGFGGTPLLARIDYVLLSKELSPVFQDVFDIPGSDHQGVIAGINVP